MKKLPAFMSTMVSALAVTGCFGASDTIKLGMIGPMTGDYAIYGTASRDGALLAIEEINAAGGVLGKQLELKIQDTQGDPAQAVPAYTLLTEQEHIVALIGGIFSGETLAIKSEAVADGLPVLSPTATNPTVTLDAPNVFRACYTDAYQGEVAASFAWDTLDVTKAGVLYNIDDSYSTGLAEAFVDKFEDLGGTVVTQTFGAGADDFNAQLTALDAADVEFVFVPTYVAEAGPILTQAATKGIDVPFMGGDGWDSIEADYATASEGHYFVNHYAKTDTAQIVVDFVANFTAKYGTAPNALAALGYDSVYTMVAAIEAAGNTDPADIVAALQATDLTDLVAGAITFDENGDPIKAATIIQVHDGDHVVVAKVTAE